MYANLNLPSPSDTGFEGQFDYANLYLTAFIVRMKQLHLII